MGTLLAFTTVAISVLILRYVPPDEVPLPSSLQESIDFTTLRLSAQETLGKGSEVHAGTSEDSKHPLLGVEEKVIDCPFIVQNTLGKCEPHILFVDACSYHKNFQLGNLCLLLLDKAKI